MAIKVTENGERLDFEPGIVVKPEELSNWFGALNFESNDLYYRPDPTDNLILRFTPDQIRALAHAGDDPNCPAAGFGTALARQAASDAVQASETANHGDYVIEAAIPSEGALLVNYKWNADADGIGTWLEQDGGWNYPMGDLVYPWKESDDDNE